MKQLFSILFLFLYFSKSYSQDTIYLKNIDDTLSIPKEKAIYYKVINTTVKPIEVTTYYTNGISVSKEHFSSLSPKIRDGEYESYFYNGKTNVKGVFKDDKMEGSWIAYNKEKGFIESKQNFKENLKHGKGFTFYENGKLKRMDTYLRDTLALSTCYDSIGNVIECKALVDTTSLESRAEVMPIFPGGVQGLFKYLNSNISTESFRELKDKINGKVVVKFYIDVDGTVKEPVVLANSTGLVECEKEALRVVLSMPKWIPGTQGGKRVKVYYVLPITFKVN